MLYVYTLFHIPNSPLCADGCVPSARVISTLRETSSAQLPSLTAADLHQVRSSDGGPCCSASGPHAEGSAREAGQASSRKRQTAPETRPDQGGIRMLPRGILAGCWSRPAKRDHRLAPTNHRPKPFRFSSGFRMRAPLASSDGGSPGDAASSSGLTGSTARAPRSSPH